MTDPNQLPPLSGQEPTPEPIEPGINPFAGNQPVEQQPSRLGLGGSVLGQAGVHIPSAAKESREDSEAYTDVQEAARKACSLIAGMFVTKGDPDSIVFPACADIEVIPQALKEIKNTALGLGYGPFPKTVSEAWTRFMDETTEHYRTTNGLGVADLVPLKIETPDWLESNPDFDILPNCKLMDIEISGSINSVMAARAENCRITFTDIVDQNALICNEANRCTVIFKSNLYAKKSFVDAQNMSVRIMGSQQGSLGTMTTSRVDCSGTFTGRFIYRGEGSSYGQGVRPTPV